MRTGIVLLTVTALVAVLTGAHAQASAEPTSPPVSSPRPTPTAPVPVAFATWQRSDLPDPAPHVYGGGTPTAMVRYRGGFVAVGSVIGDCCDGSDPLSDRGVIWTSPDARHWTLHDPIPAFAHGTVDNVVTDGRTVVAIGAVAAPHPVHPWDRIKAVWASTDGKTWVRAGKPIPTTVVAGRHGFTGVAVVDHQFATVFKSTDGRTWKVVTELQNGRKMCCMASADDGSMVAIGRAPATNSDGTQSANAMMWLSPDGIAWSGRMLVAPFASPEAVEADGDGFIAIATVFGRTPDGFAGETVGQVWRIQDGVPNLIAELPIGSDGYLQDVFVSGSTVIVTGEASPEVDAPLNAAVWVSVDGGITFGRVPDQPAFDSINNAVGSLVEIPAGIVGLGSYWETKTLHPPPAMWFSPRTVTELEFPGAARARVQ